MIHRLVTTAKQSWEDLLRPPWIEPPPIPDAIVERDKAAARAMARGRSWTAGLSDDEIDAMLEYRDIDSPTPEQQAAVERIMAKIRRWGG
jgi:hypothetical protein